MTTTPAAGKARLAVLAGCMAAMAFAAGASARSPLYDGDKARAKRVLAVAGDFSDAGLRRYVDALSPSAAEIARRHDPVAPDRFLSERPLWADVEIGVGAPLRASVWGDEAVRLNAAYPAFRTAVEPAPPFVFAGPPAERRKAARCLAQAVYYEAARESLDGQAAVAQVVLNRVRDPSFPNSICGVVFQGAELTTGCQFSFTCDGSMARRPSDWAWRRAVLVAEAALDGYVAAAVGTATHYHADYVLPYWGPTLVKLEQIGAHIFYRWPGEAGSSRALAQRWAGREPWIDEARFSRPRVAPETAVAEAAAAVSPNLTVAPAAPGERVSATLGGRRKADPAEIARINAELAKFEKTAAEPQADAGA